MKKILLFLLLSACAYSTPPRGEWGMVLRGASGEQLSPTLRVAKKPLYQDAGGMVVPAGNVRGYMDALDAKLNDTLRKPGIQINRIGTDIIVILVRSSFMYTDSPEISKMGDDLLGLLAGVLNEYDRTWIEITGYSDAMRSQENAVAFSGDMAQRVAVYLAKSKVKPIRMFWVGRGSANPIADQSDLGRLMNRRVEIRLSAVN
ncbi:MAG: OmpA family protein [Rickettsiales bacterium]|jgi:outer membrane protein OmpA-like peptidoglycan-associated protein|nr:OmpA family protein [Rickettsiales bacterium]